MSKFMSVIVAGSLGVAAACGTFSAQAQTASQTGALSTFVNNAPGATDLHKQAGYAVQGMCVALGNAGGLALPANSQSRDLFLRCNEMVQTAVALQSGSTLARSLGYTDPAQLLAAVQQVSGEELTAQGKLSTQVSAGQFGNIAGRLNALRFGSRAAAAGGRVASLDQRDRAASSLAPMNARVHADTNQPMLGAGASADVPRDARPWGWFMESNYSFGKHDQTVSEDAFDFDSFSVTIGNDYNFGSGAIGLAIGYDKYTADFDNALLVSGGDVEVDGVSGSLFAAWSGGSSWSLNGIASYGKLESDITRRAFYLSANPSCALGCGADRSLTGHPDGSYIALGTTLAYDFSAGGWDISPSVTASYRDVDIDGYDEADSQSDGGLALRYEDQTIKSTRSIVALALSRPISRTFGVLIPNLRLEWHHEFEDDARTLRAKYVLEDTLSGGSGARDFGCQISCFTFLTDAPEADFAVVGAGLAVTFARRMQAYLYYEALLGMADVSASSIALGLRGQFGQ